IRYLNQYFILANQKLCRNGLLICNGETIDQRKKRILKKYGKKALIYYPLDFLAKRVAPKLKGVKKVYFLLTHGRNRVLSKAEILGRLYYCGFEAVKISEVDNKLHMVLKKVAEPRHDLAPSYGPLYKKKAVSKNGEIIYVYKFRTMHPYSEYLQDYMRRCNGFAAKGDGVGKIQDDFRITDWGKFMRKYWLDETPQFLNLLKGDIKLVGIRPLTRSFLKEYPDDFLSERMKHRSGLLPPYAAHVHTTVAEYIDSERKYLTAYNKNPFFTDVHYFFWITYNILTNKIRSK
ncbi:sugar transferase, partial [bacterium]|nr:sugar transferase [bacterium]